MADATPGVQPSTDGATAVGAGLAAKVDFLFRTVRPRDRGEYTYKEVEVALRERGYRVSDSALHQLRTGKATNPTLRTLQALSDFFGVPADYFFDADVSARVEQELKLLASMRDQRIRSIATRAAELSATDLTLLSQLIDNMRDLGPHARNPLPGSPDHGGDHDPDQADGARHRHRP